MNRITKLVAEREIRELIRGKSFWIILVLLVLASMAGAVLPSLLGGDEESDLTLGIIGEPPSELVDQIIAVNQYFDVKIEPERNLTEEQLHIAIIDGDVSLGLVWEDQPMILHRGYDEDETITLLQETIRSYQADQILVDGGVDSTLIVEARQVGPPVTVDLDTDRNGRVGTVAIVTLVMYIGIMLLSQTVANSVAAEKANRVSEVLLAVGRPRQLLYGKVLAATLIGSATLLVAAVPMVIKLVGDGGGLPDSLGITMASAGLWFVGGVVLYVFLSACIGSMVDRVEEVGPAMMPLILILVVPYILVLSLAEKPIGVIFSLFPLTSPLFMPARIAYEAAPWWEIIASLIILAATIFFVARLAATIYGRAIVRTGKRLKFRDLR